MLRKNKIPKTNPHLNALSLAELKTSSHNFLKLDLAYLAAAGTVAGAIKIDRHEIYDVIGADFVATFVFAFLLLAAVDLFIHFHIINDIIAFNQRWKREHGCLLTVLSVYVQPFAHLIFIGIIIFGPVAYSQGYIAGRNEYHNYSVIQEAVEDYMRTEKVVPRTIEDVETKFPELRKTVGAMPNIAITIRPDGKTKYVVTFSRISKNGDRITTSLDGSVSGFDIEKAVKEKPFP